MGQENGIAMGKRELSQSSSLGQLFRRMEEAREENGGEQTWDVKPSANSHVLELAGDSATPEKPPPFVLAFSELTYSIKIPKKLSFLKRRRQNQLAAPSPESDAGGENPRTKTLLNAISGEAKEGEILAVLGASGSGKSTLIDALANRIAKGSLKGTVTLNGQLLESRLLKIISAYVMQDDLLFPMLTVEETLMFAAEFRLPRTLSTSKKRARVETLIDQLGLRGAAKTIIGDEGHRGVSGGERRRVSIGIDIVHDPILLFLDEPTSGLDSTSAFMVVKVLQRIAQRGSVVIMSVHQPSSRIIGLLDRLIFLSRGHTVYSGSPGGLPSFFAEFGRPIPESENRCEFALDVIRSLELRPRRRRQAARRVQPRAAGGEEPAKSRTIGARLLPRGRHQREHLPGRLVSGGGAGGAAAVPTFVNPFWIEMWVLTKRSFTNTGRMPELFALRMGSVMVTGIILATIFWRLDASPKGIQERLGFLAFAMETAYNAYRRSSYVLSNSLVSIPFLIILSIVFAAITFFAVGLAGGASGFFFYFLIILASFWAGNSFVTFLSGVVSDVMMGFTIVVAILAYYLLFSGFFITRERMPSYWVWFHYLSMVKYPYEAVLHNEFDDPSRCFVRGLQMFDNSPLGEVSTTMKKRMLASMSRVLMVNITSKTCVTTGPDILLQQGVTDLSKWNCLWVTVAWGFFFRILFYFALLLGGKNKRR
ncbi:unnamed protein product [Spirodela intermedia]|uniref:ABC transporter G family member 5 n=1 Tax=Spirodela intermedia TaxID=51605 RepID=A0A7I8IGM2_SPIIN|nr:unnamed protein product [Spirodela intermedia]CAA6656853.1 unnamed protein product [Spirodela intermedia]